MGIGWRALLCVAGATLALSAICVKYAYAPFIWVLLIWTTTASYLAWRATRASLRAVLINLAAVFATVAAIESYAYFSITSDSAIGRSYSAGYRGRDDVLGTAPARGVVGRSTLIYRGRLIYDTTYTIGPDGLRIEPPVAADAAQGCVLFFGDSFTFGEGLHDDETMLRRQGVEPALHQCLEFSVVDLIFRAEAGFVGHQLDERARRIAVDLRIERSRGFQQREQFVHFLVGLGRQVFEEERQEVRHLAGVDVEALPLVHLAEVDHGLPAVA